jgi:hypothetical protein
MSDTTMSPLIPQTWTDRANRAVLVALSETMNSAEMPRLWALEDYSTRRYDRQAEVAK